MRNLRKYLLVRFSKLFMMCPLFLFQTDQQPVDNLTIFNNMASMVAQKIIDRFSPDSSASISIRSQSQQQIGKWLIENVLVKSLYQRGISKIYLEKQDSTSTFVTEFQILALGVRYLPTKKKGIIERQIQINLAVRLFEGPSGLVKFFDEFNEEHTDSVHVADVARIENEYYSFTHVDLPEVKGIKKYIEPFIVMTTTAGIIYLFFRLRSN
jgi:hypothetical protein